MLEKFRQHIIHYELCRADNPPLLAVSGGIDSAVMTDLFKKAGYKNIILHCNFKLRGEESEADEAFVRAMAAECDFPVYVKNFDTEEYAKEHGISIQMAARDLRYSWFDEMSEKLNTEIIATAHNLNDSVETTLINLSRGTGIKGLTGIPIYHKNYIRPVLFATRQEIVQYARENSIRYREDSSNASVKYRRNKIRHDIIPSLEEINPSFIRTMKENMERFGEAHEIYREYVLIKRNELFIEKEDHFDIDIDKLRMMQPRASWLYELFSNFGFSREQCLGIDQIMEADSGKQFISPTHTLFKDRDRMLLFPVTQNSFERYYIDAPDKQSVLPFSLDVEVIAREELGTIPSSETIACLDMDKLNFPLIVRKWQHGDYFYPLGMEHIKKVSDFFIDNKVPVPVKSRTWIISSGKMLVWIAGFRIDHRFRITDKTTRVLKLQLYDS